MYDTQCIVVCQHRTHHITLIVYCIINYFLCLIIIMIMMALSHRQALTVVPITVWCVFHLIVALSDAKPSST